MTIGIVLVSAAIGLFVALWRESFRYVGGLRGSAHAVADAEWGLAELRVPAPWQPARDLNDAASIQAIDVVRSRYAIVISDAREDIAPAIDLNTYSAQGREALCSTMTLRAVRGPEHTTVAGYPAVQYEIDGVHDDTNITYLHTSVAGRRAFHQVLFWAQRSRYQRTVFEELLAGFRELPGPAPSGPQPIPVRANHRKPIGFRP